MAKLTSFNVIRERKKRVIKERDDVLDILPYIQCSYISPDGPSSLGVSNVPSEIDGSDRDGGYFLGEVFFWTW